VCDKKKSLRILLVEDEVISAMQMKAELQREGFTVLKFVTTGEEAVDYASREKPGLLLMDINLAGKMDGIDAATRIRAIYPVSVIFISGYDDADLKKRAETASPVRYLVKPVRTAELAAIIDSWLENSAD